MKKILVSLVLFLLSPLVLAKDLSKVKACQLHHQDSCSYYDCHRLFKHRFYKVCDGEKNKLTDKEWLEAIIKTNKQAEQITTQDAFDYEAIEMEGIIEEARKGGKE